MSPEDELIAIANEAKERGVKSYRALPLAPDWDHNRDTNKKRDRNSILTAGLIICIVVLMIILFVIFGGVP